MAAPSMALHGLHSSAFQNLSFQKERGLNEDRAKVMGSNGHAGIAWRIEGEQKMAANAKELGGTKFGPLGDFVPKIFPLTAEPLSAVILQLPLTRKETGLIAGASPETVKAWTKDRQKPQWEHLHPMAMEIPSVRAWTLQRLGVKASRGLPEFVTPELLTAMMAALHQVSYQPGPDGDAVRAVLHKIYGGG